MSARRERRALRLALSGSAMLMVMAAGVSSRSASAQPATVEREIAVVVRVTTDPAFDSSGSPVASAAREARRLTLRLAALHSDELEGVPFALSIPGVVCDELRLMRTAQSRELLRELRRHARRAPVLATTYADVRLGELKASQIKDEVEDGEDAVRTCTGAEPRRLFVPPDLTLPRSEILEPLRDAGALVALSAFAVPPATERPTIVPAVSFGKEDDLDSLAAARPEAPAIAVVIDAQRENVAAIVRDLADDERFALRSVGALARLDVIRGAIDPETGDVPSAYRTAIDSAAESLAQLRTVALPDNRNLAIYRTVLARARSSAVFDDHDVGRDNADALRGTLERELDSVSVPDGSVTFTSSRGSIPVTISNRAKYPLRVMVVLSSPKLSFPADNKQVVTIEPPGDTITFDAIARSTGTFPTAVIVSDPLRKVTLARGELAVRSTAANLSAVVLTAGGALFLIVWLVRRVRSRRREEARAS